jgi:hypothetical protein
MHAWWDNIFNENTFQQLLLVHENVFIPCNSSSTGVFGIAINEDIA